MARGKRLKNQKKREEREKKAAPPPKPKPQKPKEGKITSETLPEAFARREERIEVWKLGEHRWMLVDGMEVLQREWIGQRSGVTEWRTLYQFQSTADGQIKVPVSRIPASQDNYKRG